MEAPKLITDRKIGFNQLVMPVDNGNRKPHCQQHTASPFSRFEDIVVKNKMVQNLFARIHSARCTWERIIAVLRFIEQMKKSVIPRQVQFHICYLQFHRTITE